MYAVMEIMNKSYVVIRLVVFETQEISRIMAKVTPKGKKLDGLV